jgi:two-component sensor histidine kinase
VQKKVHIRTKIFFIVLVALIPTVIITVWSALQFGQKDLQEKLTSLTNQCEGFVNEQRLIIRNAREMLLAISETRAVKEADFATLNTYLGDLMRINPDYAVLIATDGQGNVVASGINKTGYSNADRPYVRDALVSGKFVVGEYIISKSTGRPALPFALPARDRDGNVIVLVATFDLENYEKDLSTTRIPRDCVLEIFDNSGLELYTSEYNLDRKVSLGKPVDPELLRAARATPVIGTSSVMLGGAEYFVTSGSYTENGTSIYITLRAPRALISADSSRAAALIFTIMLMGCVLAFALSLWLARRLFVGRIESLTAYIADLASGNLSVRSEINTARDEITELMESFNTMASALEERSLSNQQVIAEKEELLRELQKRVSDNLQLLSSLVHLQIEYSAEEPVRHSLMTTHSRIMALSLVYETIYRFSDVQRVSMQRYANGLCEFLLSLYADVGSDISCSIAGVDVSLPIERALPVALLLNECVSNSILHAFPEGRPGSIQVLFEQPYPAAMQVSIVDNGIGFEGDVHFKETLGYEMIEALVEQVRGTLTVSSTNAGTSISLIFGID